MGGDFAMQVQGLNQSNAEGYLVELGTDFNLPSANLNLDVQLLDGVRMHLNRQREAIGRRNENLEISSVNVGGRMVHFKEYLTKVEHVDKQYKCNAWTGRSAGAEFSGVNIEAVIKSVFKL